MSLAAFAALLMAGSTASVGAQGQQVVVIQGGTLIDGLGGAPVANSVIVIEGDRISAVGAAGQVNVPNGAEVIDASGKWVLPGLVDAKANWNWMYGEAFLHYGVTSAMVSGGRNNTGLADRDAINHGIYRGPRLYQTAVTINGPGPGLDKPQNYNPGGGSRRIYTGEEGVEHVASFVGGSQIRFLLTYTPENNYQSYAQLLVTVEDFRAIPTMLNTTLEHLEEMFPEAVINSKAFMLGPSEGGKIQLRINGPDPQVLRELGAVAQGIMEADPVAKGVRNEWRNKVLLLRPQGLLPLTYKPLTLLKTGN